MERTRLAIIYDELSRDLFRRLAAVSYPSAAKDI
jgi:hypothetical protein